MGGIIDHKQQKRLSSHSFQTRLTWSRNHECGHIGHRLSPTCFYVTPGQGPQCFRVKIRVCFNQLILFGMIQQYKSRTLQYSTHTVTGIYNQNAQGCTQTIEKSCICVTRSTLSLHTKLTLQNKYMRTKMPSFTVMLQSRAPWSTDVASPATPLQSKSPVALAGVAHVRCSVHVHWR